MKPILSSGSLKRSSRFFGLAALAAASLSACAGPPREVPPPPAPAAPPPPVAQASCLPAFIDTGVASWYGEAFQMRATASGEPFDMNDLTAAHRWLPLNTIVRVTNLENGKSAVLRINDRGPYLHGRVLDVSSYAAQQLGMKRHGLAQVRIEVFDLDQRGSDQEATLTGHARRADDEAVYNSGKTAAHFPHVGTLVEHP
jgi:rare lipoprotein A (peptidoglycan hydrolase)